jgi:hypothetical protein
MTETTPLDDSTPERLTLQGLALASSSKRRQFSARFVRAGRVRAAGNRQSDIELTENALMRAFNKGLFDGRAVFIDHASWYEHPSIRNLAGFTSNAAWDPAEKAITGTITLYSQAEQVADLLAELLADQGAAPHVAPHVAPDVVPHVAPDIGLSIVFWPVWQTSGKTKKIIDIQHVESVDIVFEPAAGGRFLQALSAAAQTIPAGSGGAGMPPARTPQEAHSISGGLQMPGQLNNTHIRRESNPAPAGNPDEWAGAWMQSMATASAGVMIANSGLPPASRQRLGERHYSSPEEVQQAIQAEQAYLAALHQDNVIQIGNVAPRTPHVSVGLTGLDEVQLALDALLAGRRPEKGARPISGIRELYLHLSGDYEMAGLFHPERVQFANVNSSTMANMTADALNKIVANAFQQYPHWWEKIIIAEDFASLQSVKWVTLGGVGELPTVAEGAAYTELTWDDTKETATFVKKGGYLGLTLEAIDKDDTRRLRAAPRALAQAAWLTLSKAVSAVFTDNSGTGPTMSDSIALFNASHGNLGSTALSSGEYGVVRTAMRKQTELNSGERLGALTAPKYLLVPPDLEITALKVLASQADYTYALSNGTSAPQNAFSEGDTHNERLAFARERVIVVDLWTDTNNWAAVCDPILWPTIGVGFRYGRTPEIFSVASPTAGLMFTNDTLPIKVRYFFAVAPIDYRGMYKENVA